MSQFQSMQLPPRLPLATRIDLRDSTIDYSSGFPRASRIVNGLVEQAENSNEFRIRKRPCLSTITGYADGATGRGMGIYSASGGPDVYSIFGTFVTSARLWYNNSNLGAVDPNDTFYNFILAGKYLVMHNTSKAYYVDTTAPGAPTQITDADFLLITLVRGMAYLDGTLYVLDRDGSIYGSDIGSVSAWNPLNKIQANAQSDIGVVLTQQLNYVIAIKSWSTEVFYDNANATGSPLKRMDGGYIPYGCVSGRTLQEIDGSLIWLAANRNAAPVVVMMTNLQLKVISTTSVAKALENFQDKVIASGEVTSWTFRTAGHRYYGISAGDYCLVFDLDSDWWYQWTDSTNARWPVFYATYAKSGLTTNPLIRLVQTFNDALIYKVNEDYDVAMDVGVPFPVDIITPRFDANVNREKYLNKMYFNGDVTPGSILQVRWSDDDMKTWSPFRSVDMGQVRPFLDDCGSFYRRNFHLRQYTNKPLRLESIDLEMDVGTL